MPNLKIRTQNQYKLIDYPVYQQDFNGTHKLINSKGLVAYGNLYNVRDVDLPSDQNISGDILYGFHVTTPVAITQDYVGVSDETLTQAVDLVTKYAYPSYQLDVAKLSSVTSAVPFKVIEGDLSGYGPYGVLWRGVVMNRSTGSGNWGTIDVFKHKSSGTVRLRVQVPEARADFFGTIGDFGTEQDVTKTFYCITGTDDITNNVGVHTAPTLAGQKYLKFDVRVRLYLNKTFDVDMVIAAEHVDNNRPSASNNTGINVATIIPYAMYRDNQDPIALSGYTGDLNDVRYNFNPYNIGIETGNVIVKIGGTTFTDANHGSSVRPDTSPTFVIEAK